MAFSNSVFRAVEAIFPRQQKNIFSINLPTVHWSMVLFRKRLSSRTCSCYVSGFTKTDVGLEGKINSVRLCHLKASPDLTPSFILLGRQFTGIIDAVNDGLFHMKERHMSTRNPGKTRVTESKQELKPKLNTGPGVPYHELPIIFVNATSNNTMITVTDHTGKPAARASAGTEGFKNAKKGTNVAGQAAGLAAAKKATTLGVKSARVKIKGMGPGRQTSVRGLLSGGIEVISITDVTPIPHGGYRPRKKRRL